ncbi:MAG: NnrS family protein [Deltaproteobacteria bacterium]|nr:MAG: NnrS family protein [Deltaproteobacteria bacterium]
MSLWDTGFRPFFLLAAVWAVLAPLWWAGVLTGHAPHLATLDPLAWHVHEMLSGFIGAVVAGFLLTAVQNWTGGKTASGAGLAGLAGLWAAARLQSVVDLGGLGLVLDLAFFPALAVAIGRPLWQSRNRRNALFPALLLVLAGADASLHWGADPRWIGRVAVDAVTLMVVLVGGRIIPMFTRNALGTRPVLRPPVEALALASVGALLVWDAAGLAGAGGVAGVACLVHLARLSGWGGLATLRHPILWVLHLGYLWMVLGLGARGLADAGVLPASAAIHLLTIGSIGTLTLGMMSRVALGHTGRALVAPVPMGAAFALISLATVLRAMWSSQPDPRLLWGSALAFSLAFTAYTLRYAGMLVGPRADGRPG